MLIEREWLTARFRRLAPDFECTPEVLRGLHFIASAILMIQAQLGYYAGLYSGVRMILNEAK